MELICFDFVNSEWRDHLTGGRQERLRDPVWREKFLVGMGWNGALEPSEADLAEAGRLRELLWRMIVRLAECDMPADSDLALLNEFLAASPVLRAIEKKSNDGYCVTQTPQTRTWAAFLGEIAASFADVIAKKDPLRLRICANPTCRWVFFDESKNRTRRWCGDTCGTLVKVREFRARQRRRNASD